MLELRLSNISHKWACYYVISYMRNKPEPLAAINLCMHTEMSKIAMVFCATLGMLLRYLHVVTIAAINLCIYREMSKNMHCTCTGCALRLNKSTSGRGDSPRFTTSFKYHSAGCAQITWSVHYHG